MHTIRHIAGLVCMENHMASLQMCVRNCNVFPSPPFILDPQSSQQIFLIVIYLFQWLIILSPRISMILSIIPLLSTATREQVNLDGGSANL